jgi:hypothetical protein
MLPTDRDAFLSFIRTDELVEILAEGDTSPIVRPLQTIAPAGHRKLYLWNRRHLPILKRKWVPGGRFYGVSALDCPVLELINSAEVTWEQKPALVQGRLYGVFDDYLEKPPEFAKWYEKLVRWIRKNWKRGPISMGGYLGPDAYDFYQKGGYLLPQFVPPPTTEWLVEINKQH